MLRTFDHEDSFAHLSNAELRLDLAAAETAKCPTHVAHWRKANRIQALTDELLRRGAY